MLLLFIFNWFLMGSIASYYSKKRGRDPYIWFFVGLLFGILGILLLFHLPKKLENTLPEEKAPEPEPLPLMNDTPLFWYYVDAQGTRQGPISKNAFEKATFEGKILPSSYVWNTQMSEWKRLEEI